MFFLLFFSCLLFSYCLFLVSFCFLLVPCCLLLVPCSLFLVALCLFLRPQLPAPGSRLAWSWSRLAQVPARLLPAAAYHSFCLLPVQFILALFSLFGIHGLRITLCFFLIVHGNSFCRCRWYRKFRN